MIAVVLNIQGVSSSTIGLPGPIDDWLIDNVVETWFQFVYGMINGIAVAFNNYFVDVLLRQSEVSLTDDLTKIDGARSLMLGLALVLLFAMVLSRVVRGAISGNGGDVVRALAIDVPSVIAYLVIYASVAHVAIVVVDQLSYALLAGEGGGASTASALGKIVAFPSAMASIQPAAGPGGSIVRAFTTALVIQLIWAIAAIILIVEMHVRSALIYVLIAAAPLGYVTRASTSHGLIATRTTRALIALIGSKLGICLCLAVGAGLLDPGAAAELPSTIKEGGMEMGPVMVGVTAMLMASFSPFWVMQMIPVFDADDEGGYEGTNSRVTGGASLIGNSISIGKFLARK